ncbi:DUF4864 domain-containing protein [Methylobacterium gregans]|uniref:DUF4864 domain-containing protein n=1 Tax=Methylobacterium gregans TaxID=374424 RepID=A0AA37MCI3_9HYPH|nr:DUF4864 domain-containing protein [Methylobacterium gregans]MDQ0519280.1 hypothetical protein [Methylobacterium gregans]GJD79801.1 hypothetical protein NBEOAGPD_3031 [Methylobacterium gregans]GLS53081.1 DUF4864 domain-containing protein [Methylobacterium gregans]
MGARLTPLIFLPALLLAVSPVAALDEADHAAAKTVIMRQVEALGRDDAATAYDQAAPGIRSLFPTPDVFIGMVRTSYRPIYRHRSFVFSGKQDGSETTLTQSVAIQDTDGIDWTAEYSLERQSDGQWRIAGCRLIKSPGINL